MSTTDDRLEEEPTLQETVSGDAVEPQSVLDSLRRKREDISGIKTVDLVVPGYDKDPPVLYIRYGLMDGAEIDRITRKVFRETKDRWERQLLSAIDAMIAACEGFYIDMQDGSERKPLTVGGEPVLNFGQVGEALAFEASSARQAVKELFGNNDVALAQHNIQLSRWMGNTTTEVDDELLGGNF